MVTITANDQYRHPPRISRTRFHARLQASANAGVLAERPADTYYDECVRQGIDPLFVLAMFNHESSMGRAGVAVQTKSWGNTRSPNFGATPIGTVPGLSGTFPIWASWLDGVRSTCARLVTQDWYYGYEQRNIGEVFDDPHFPVRYPAKPIFQPPRLVQNGPREWAPAGDLNNPAAYLASMLRFMNDNADLDSGGSVGKFPKPTMINYPSPNRDGYGTPRKILAIVDHITNGRRAGDLAHMTNPNSKASCNCYITKDGTKYELVPIWSSSYANGPIKNPDLSNPIIKGIVDAGVNPNTQTYAIEHEAFAGEALTEEQVNSSIEVHAWVASEVDLNLSRTTVIGHYQIDSVDRHYCPSFPDATWNRLITGARALLDPGVDPEVPKRCFPDIDGIDSCIVWGFKGYWEQLEADGLAYLVLGYPHTDEFATKVDGIERHVQLFERGGLAWYPESAGTPWEFRHLTRGELWSAVNDAREQGVLA